jgi:hypothetical protein
MIPSRWGWTTASTKVALFASSRAPDLAIQGGQTRRSPLLASREDQGDSPAGVADARFEQAAGWALMLLWCLSARE